MSWYHLGLEGTCYHAKIDEFIGFLIFILLTWVNSTTFLSLYLGLKGLVKLEVLQISKTYLSRELNMIQLLCIVEDWIKINNLWTFYLN